ncbi:MAG: 2TM domain-containing protein [Ginsengibacter sp.]
MNDQTMINPEPNQVGAKDADLWQLAQKRVGFKNHLLSYVLVNLFFWLVWYSSGHRHNNDAGIPWPVWPMVGWGIGLASHYAGAYIFPKSNAVEKEYQKLKNKNG